MSPLAPLLDAAVHGTTRNPLDSNEWCDKSVPGCIAAAVAPSTQVLNFGMHVGEKLASVTNAALASLLQRSGTPAVSEDVKKWQTFTVDFVCYAASVTTTFYLQRVANAYQVIFQAVRPSIVLVEFGSCEVRKRKSDWSSNIAKCVASLL
jgi:hypothetical protein